MSGHAPAAAPNTQALLSLLRAHQPRWADRFHLQRIGLFGSVARGDATDESDVDVWVELEPLIPFATVHLKRELEALLQHPVDLVRLRERMNPALLAPPAGFHSLLSWVCRPAASILCFRPQNRRDG